jgi:hypothetical protein
MRSQPILIFLRWYETTLLSQEGEGSRTTFYKASRRLSGMA